MRFVNMYFVGYVIFLVGVAMALWKLGALQSLAPIWIVIGVLMAIGLGVMFAISGGKPDITKE